MILALRKIPNLPSSTIVAVINDAYLRSPPPPSLSTPHDNNAIDIDIKVKSSFASILQCTLDLPPPAPDYRAALYALSVECCTAIISQYVAWLDAHVQRIPSTLSIWTISPSSISPSTPLSPESPSNPLSQPLPFTTGEQLPTVQSLISHSTALLDGQLQSLLSHPPAYEPLQQMQDALDILLGIQDTYRKIRAPVEAVLTLGRREEARMEELRSKREVLRKFGSKGSGEGKSKGVRTERDYGIGGEAVGKWRVEDLVF